MARRTKYGLMAALVALLVTACTLSENDQYRATFGLGGIQVTIFQRPTGQIIRLRRTLGWNMGLDPTRHDRPTVDTAKLLAGGVQPSGAGAAEWNDAIRYNVIPDLRDNMNAIDWSVTGADDTWNYCLGITKNFWGTINWINRPYWDANCLRGKVFG